MTPFFQLIFVLIAAGVVCWLVMQAEFIAPFFKACIYAVVGLAALGYVIRHLPALGLG